MIFFSYTLKKKKKSFCAAKKYVIYIEATEAIQPFYQDIGMLKQAAVN